MVLVATTALTAVLWGVPVMVSLKGDVEDLERLMAIPGWAPLAGVMAKVVWMVPVVVLGMWLWKPRQRRSRERPGLPKTPPVP